MKRGTPDHPKTIDLQQRLGETRRGVVGLLEMLWHWCQKYAPAGDIGRWDDAAIAAAVQWDKDPSQLVEALVGAGWLDAHPDCRLAVHDWHEHADDSVHMALYRAVRTFVNGDEPKSARISLKDRAKLEPRWESYRSELAVRTGSARRAHAVRTESAPPGLARPGPSRPEPGPAVPPAAAGADGDGAAYLAAVAPPAEQILRRRLNRSERALVERWRHDGVPVRTVLRAIRDTTEPEPGKRRSQPHTLQYFDQAVLEAHIRRARALGAIGGGTTDQDRPPPRSDPAIATWELVGQRIRERVQTQTWDLWFAAARGHAVVGNTLQVMVPVAHVGQWIQQHFGNVVAEAVRACGLTCQVEYLAESEAAG